MLKCQADANVHNVQIQRFILKLILTMTTLIANSWRNTLVIRNLFFLIISNVENTFFELQSFYCDKIKDEKLGSI